MENYPPDKSRVRNVAPARYTNRAGIPAEVKTVQVPASYWDGEWKATTAVIKLVKK